MPSGSLTALQGTENGLSYVSQRKQRVSDVQGDAQSTSRHLQCVSLFHNPLQSILKTSHNIEGDEEVHYT